VHKLNIFNNNGNGNSNMKKLIAAILLTTISFGAMADRLDDLTDAENLLFKTGSTIQDYKKALGLSVPYAVQDDILAQYNAFTANIKICEVYEAQGDIRSLKECTSGALLWGGKIQQHRDVAAVYANGMSRKDMSTTMYNLRNIAIVLDVK